MTTQQVADKFDELAQKGAYDVILDELYSNDAVSIEPENSFFKNVQGMDAIKEKAKQFNAMIEEMHSGYCNKSIVAGNYFACTMGMDVTIKGQPRMQMDEVAVYQVKDGKIISEQFFF